MGAGSRDRADVSRDGEDSQVLLAAVSERAAGVLSCMGFKQVEGQQQAEAAAAVVEVEVVVHLIT